MLPLEVKYSATAGQAPYIGSGSIIPDVFLALVYRLADARRHLKRLHVVRPGSFPGSVSNAEVVSRLDMVNFLIRLQKEETSFFVRPGELNDLVRSFDRSFEWLERQDPVIFYKIFMNTRNGIGGG